MKSATRCFSCATTAAGARIAPLVLVGVDFWTRVRPAWPLLANLAEGRGLAAAVHLVDDVDEVVSLLT